MTTRPSASEAPEATLEDESLPLDTVFDLLSNERRRRTLRYLLAGPENPTLGDLAEHLASIENDKPRAALSSSERKRVYVCLYQSHLPKLDEAGVIDFDVERKTIELAGNADQVVRFLPEADDGGASTDTGNWSAWVTEFARTLARRLRITETA